MTSLQANPLFTQSDNYVLERERERIRREGRERKRLEERKKEKKGIKKKLKVYNVIIQKSLKPV
jgi:hypothetical protein